MKNLKQNLLSVLTLILFVAAGAVSTANAQQLPKNPENFSRRADVTLEQQQDSSIGQRTRALRDLEKTNNSRDAVYAGRRAKIVNTSEIESILRPPSEYYDKYAELLKNKNMNLARIFVEKNCDQGTIVSVQELERCGGVIPVMGGGSYYSFRLKDVRLNDSKFFRRDWWDVHFVDNKFSVGNDTVQTIISEIGPVDLQTVSFQSEALAFLRKYEPKQTLADIKEQNKILGKGINFKNLTYSNVAAVKLDSTYVLRSVAYRVKEEKQISNSGKGIDMFVAFKIVGREDDGSLIILWKGLRTDLPRKELE